MKKGESEARESQFIDGIMHNPHPNGGGLVAVTATVDPIVFISPESIVSGNSSITGRVILKGKTVVSGRAKISGSIVFQDCTITGDATIININPRSTTVMKNTQVGSLAA